MGSYEAVADASETIVELLRARMSDLVGANEIALVSPGTTGTDGAPRLSLFLYRTTVNPYLRNAEQSRDGANRSSDRSVALDLHYLLTAHPSDAGSDETVRSLEQHRVLGRAIQVLAENAVVTGSDLRASVAGDRELRVVVDAQSPNDVFEVWSTFTDVPFEPSLTCVVGPVFVETAAPPEAQRVVRERIDRHQLVESDERE